MSLKAYIDTILPMKETNYIIQIEHGHLKWEVCALCEPKKFVMKRSFKNLIILILLIRNGGLGAHEVTREYRIPESDSYSA